MSFTRVLAADVLFVEKPLRRDRGMESEGSKRQRRGVQEAKDVSYFDIPTVPFWLKNFHFRGQSQTLTATLVL